MKTSWNKMPTWAGFLAVLLGVPLAAALLRVGFEQEFHKLTATALALVALVVLWLLLNWYFTSHPVRVEMTREEKRRDRRKFDFCLALFLAGIFLVGGVMFLAIVVSPLPDLPSVGRWLIRAASLFFGLLGLVLSLFFVLQCRFIVTGKRSLTFHLRKISSDK